MALKGKKKSRVRGSQARRKPAAAPRPTYGSGQKARWYQTTAGLVIGFLIAATVLIFVWWWIADSRSDSQALENRQSELQTYTTSIRTMIQNLTPLASELQTGASLGDGEIPEKATAWKDQLAEVETALNQAAPPVDLSALHGLVAQGTRLYAQSIEQYELLPALEGSTRDELSAKATASAAAGNNLFTVLIELLDEERQDAEMGASGLTAPGAQENAAAPTEPLDTTEGGDEGGG
jgi:hypothetical protein